MSTRLTFADRTTYGYVDIKEKKSLFCVLTTGLSSQGVERKKMSSYCCGFFKCFQCLHRHFVAGEFKVFIIIITQYIVVILQRYLKIMAHQAECLSCTGNTRSYNTYLHTRTCTCIGGQKPGSTYVLSVPVHHSTYAAASNLNSQSVVLPYVRMCKKIFLLAMYGGETRLDPPSQTCANVNRCDRRATNDLGITKHE